MNICRHTSTTSELLPPGGQHFAKLRCSACGAFLQFLPKPENQQRRIINGYRLAKLQMAPGLNLWERQFVDTLTKLGNNKLSPKQQSVFDHICLTHLERRAA